MSPLFCSNWDTKELSKSGAPLIVSQIEHNFSFLPYKREKKFPTQKYWSNRPILMLTFFCFDILKLTDTFITDNWGEREDTQKVLVAICTLEYFSWLYTFIFVQMFFFFSSSLEPLFFQCSYRTYFFRSSYISWKNILFQKFNSINGNECNHKLLQTWCWISNSI